MNPKKNKKQNLVKGKIVLLILFTLILQKQLYSQNLWGKLYDNYYYKTENKGNYGNINNKFIVTGTSKNLAGINLAYILETDQNGAITWQTYLGDSIYNFIGNSIIETNNGSYVVVGKTNKSQSYIGTYEDSCTLSYKYYNAFIAYIDPDSSAGNWYYIFGDSTLDDEAVEVIQDNSGYLVVTGTAGGKMSADSCLLNNNRYVCTKGNDQAGIMIAKFDISGNIIFNKYFFDYKFDNGISIVQDNSSSNYILLINRRDSSRNSKIFPLVLVVDIAGNFNKAAEYVDSNTYERIAREIIWHNDGYFVTGNENYINGNATTSFICDIDYALNMINYSRIIHPYINLLTKDILLDIDTIVASGDLTDTISSYGVKRKFLIKFKYDKANGFDLINLSSGTNITHYYSYGFEDNTNFCIYPFTDTSGYNHNGYHLFGNSNNIFSDHVKTDHFTYSSCYETDTITLLDSNLNNNYINFYEDNLDTFEKFDTIPSYFYDFADCDSLLIPISNNTASKNAAINEKNIIIYPNPVSTKLNIELPIIHFEKNIAIYNYTGVLVYSNKLNKEVDNMTINTQNWEKGLYIAVINYNNKSKIVRFIKE